jgi:hypothetical protein
MICSHLSFPKRILIQQALIQCLSFKQIAWDLRRHRFIYQSIPSYDLSTMTIYRIVPAIGKAFV